MSFFDSQPKTYPRAPKREIRERSFADAQVQLPRGVSRPSSPSTGRSSWVQDPNLLAGKQSYENGDRKSAILYFGKSMTDNNNPLGALGLAGVLEEMFFTLTQGEPYCIGSSEQMDGLLTGIISSTFFAWGTDQQLAEEFDVQACLRRVADGCSSAAEFNQLCMQFIQNLDLDDLDLFF